MKHFPPSLYSDWMRFPPTGTVLARELARAFDRSEFIAELARLSGRTEQYVEWQLSLDTVVPACLLTAVLRLRKLRISDDAGAREPGLSLSRVRRHG
jgi:hypothetical protein